MVAVEVALDDAFSFEALQTVGEKVGRDPLERLEQVLELAALSKQEVTQYKDGPAVADNVQGAGDRAAGLRFVGPFQS